MKKYKLLTILLISTLLITGCSNKKSKVDGPTFNTLAKNSGIGTTDVTQYYGYADKAYQSNHEKYKVLYVDFKDNGVDTQGIFIDQVNNLYSRAGVSEGETKTSQTNVAELTTKAYKKDNDTGDNWVYVKLETSEGFFYIAKVDDTMLYITSDLENKDKMEELISAMKY